MAEAERRRTKLVWKPLELAEGVANQWFNLRRRGEAAAHRLQFRRWQTRRKDCFKKFVCKLKTLPQPKGVSYPQRWERAKRATTGERAKRASPSDNLRKFAVIPVTPICAV